MIIRDCFYIVDKEDFNKNFIKTVKKHKYWEEVTYTYRGIPLYLNTNPTRLEFPIYLEKTCESCDNQVVFYQRSREEALEYWNELLTRA